MKPTPDDIPSDRIPGMSKNDWILITNIHMTDSFVVERTEQRVIEIQPRDGLRVGDRAFLWNVVDSSYWAVGEVISTPRPILKRRGDSEYRMLEITVSNLTGIMPHLTQDILNRRAGRGKLIPATSGGPIAIQLRPGIAALLADLAVEYSQYQTIEAGILPSSSIGWIVEPASPQINIAGILTFGESTDEGQLVELVRTSWDALIDRFTKNPKELLEVDPRELEEIVAGAYHRAGAEVTLTPRSGDKGRDVIARIRGIGTFQVYDQVKRYAIHREVTADEVRALYGAVEIGRASKGFVTTTSDFAPGVFDEFKHLMPQRIELRNGNALLQWLQELKGTPKRS